MQLPQTHKHYKMRLGLYPENQASVKVGVLLLVFSLTYFADSLPVSRFFYRSSRLSFVLVCGVYKRPALLCLFSCRRAGNAALSLNALWLPPPGCVDEALGYSAY